MAKDTVGEELFGLVEQDLGYAWISDGITAAGYSDEQVFNIARASIKHCEIAAKKMRRFLKKHGQPEQ